MKISWTYPVLLALLACTLSCKKPEVEFDKTYSNDETVVMSVNMVSMLPQELVMDVNIATLDKEHTIDGATQDRYIDNSAVEFYNYIGYTMTLEELAEEAVPIQANYSLAILMDKSTPDYIYDEDRKHMEGWSYFIQNNQPSNEFLLATYATSQGSTYKLFTDGFTNEAEENVENLLNVASVAKSGTSNMYDAISAMLDYVNVNANNANKHILVHWHNRESVSSATMEELISKADSFGISINFLAKYNQKSGNDFYYYGDCAKIAAKTGGCMLIGGGSTSSEITSIYSLDRLLSGDYVNRRLRIRVELSSGSFISYFGFYFNVDNLICATVEF